MKLGEVIKLVNEKIDTSFLSKEEYVSTENMIPNFGGIQFATNIPSGKCTKFSDGDVLISNIRPYFKKVWFAKHSGGCSADVLVLRGSALIEPRFLYYLVANEKFIAYYNSSCKGTKMPRGNKDALFEYEAALPKFQIQQHIVNTIGTVDDLIENYQQEIDKICELLDKSLLQYPNRVEISSYNPKIIKSGIDSFLNSKEYLDTSSVEGVNNISVGEEITISKRPSRANMQPVKNSVWFAKMKGSCKKLIITADDFDLTDHYILSTGFQGLLATKELPLSLLSAFVISKDFDVQRDLHSVGTTMAGINNETFMKMLVPQLSIQEMEEFDKKYFPLIKLLSKRRKEIAKLKTIKQQLLQKYF